MEIILFLGVIAIIIWIVWKVRTHDRALEKAALDQAWRIVLDDPHYAALRYCGDILCRACAFIADLAQPTGSRKSWRGRIRVAAEIHPDHIVLTANYKTIDSALH